MFSIPRNVKFFKIVFPNKLFAKFVDISNIKQQTEVFRTLVKDLKELPVIEF